MNKSYYDFIPEITAEELYERLVRYGMFSEKLPPIFTTESFFDYCNTQKLQAFQDRWYGYISYENIRFCHRMGCRLTLC